PNLKIISAYLYIQNFALNLEDHLFRLHNRLLNDNYQHSAYISFFVHDPKLRHIHKAPVVDRVLHHAVMRVLEPIFEKSFIFDSYSSRKHKGTHKAVKRLHQFAWKLSRNNTRAVWALQCDIRRFFDSVDHIILEGLTKKKIADTPTIKLLHAIIDSFHTQAGKGIPLGNVTSQLFSNIYMNPFDQYMKRTAMAKYYLRYADDFVVLSRDRNYLEELISKMRNFLYDSLRLEMHPAKISIRKWTHGIDFLGYVSFPYYAILRTKTKKRMLKKMRKRRALFQQGVITEYSFNQSLQSYLGILKHCRGSQLANVLLTESLL
ncbi:MAG: reverse transcriptase/maturase family protein, partial [Patescibacteria group bacterium]